MAEQLPVFKRSGICFLINMVREREIKSLIAVGKCQNLADYIQMIVTINFKCNFPKIRIILVWMLPDYLHHHFSRQTSAAGDVPLTSATTTTGFMPLTSSSTYASLKYYFLIRFPD